MIDKIIYIEILKYLLTVHNKSYEHIIYHIFLIIHKYDDYKLKTVNDDIISQFIEYLKIDNIIIIDKVFISINKNNIIKYLRKEKLDNIYG